MTRGSSARLGNCPRHRSVLKTLACLFTAAALSLATGLLSGCQSELLNTIGSTPGGHVSRVQFGSSESNAGSLKVDSAYGAVPLPGDIIEPGDQVQVMVWGHPEFNTTTTVKNYGTITIPLLGNVVAEGLTEDQLTRELQQRLSAYIKGNVTVTVSHVSMGKRVSVMGAVTKQGNYPAVGEMSLVEIIADAGGAAPNADLWHVKIFTGGRVGDAEDVNLEQYLESGSIGNVPEIKPGDTVFVPAEDNLVREISRYGEDVLVLFGFFSLLR